MRFLVLCFAFLAAIMPVQAKVDVAIDLSQQTMHVTSASGEHTWPISSARSGFSTPGGSYAPTRLEVMHYSHKYHMSPMPHAIFFRGGYAIHGTYATADLGRPASHGCVRLAPGNAARLFAMVKAEGARISISGAPPLGAARVAKRQRPREMDANTDFAAHQYGYDTPTEDTDAVAPVAAPRRRTARKTYPGYHYVGHVNGNNVYQADQRYPPPAPPFYSGGPLD